MKKFEEVCKQIALLRDAHTTTTRGRLLLQDRALQNNSSERCTPAAYLI